MPRPKKIKGAVAESPAARLSSDDSDDNSAPTDVGGLLESAICRITASFTTTFNTCVDKLIASIDCKLSMKLDAQAGDIFRLAERLDKVEKRNEQLARENLTLRDSLKSLQQKADHLEGKVDDMGTESRSTSLLIHGVRETDATQAEVKAQVIRILNDKIVEAKLSETDVTTVERMGPRRSAATAAQAGGRQKVSPILIKLTTKDTRDRILRNRRQLKDNGVGYQ